MQSSRNPSLNSLPDEDEWFSPNLLGHVTIDRMNEDVLRPAGNILFVTILSLVPGLGSFLVGYDFGAVSSAIISDPTIYQGAGLIYVYGMGGVLVELWVGLGAFGAVIGCLVALGIADYISRRGTMLISAACYFGGSIIVGASVGYGSVYTGRFLYGLGIGLGVHASSLYVSEISPPKYRGAVFTLAEFALLTGLLCGYTQPIIWFKVLEGWRYIFLLATIPSLLLFLLTLLLPPSPRWLVLKALDSSNPMARDLLLEQAHTALSTIRRLPPDAVQYEFNEIVDGQAGERKRNTALHLYCTYKSFHRAAIIGICMMFFVVATGEKIILYYIVDIFLYSGFDSVRLAIYASMTIAIVRILVSVFTAGIIERLGRRPILIASMTIIFISVALLSFVTIPTTYPNLLGQASDGLELAVAIAVLLLMYVYMAGYSLGLGSAALLVITEIVPPRIRAKTFSMVIFFYFLFIFLLCSLFFTLNSTIGISGGFFLATVFTFVGLICFIVFAPETLGRTLEQIEKGLRESLVVWNPKEFLKRCYSAK